MNRNQILVGTLILVLSWTTIAAVTFAITREISEYEPPFGSYDFDVCFRDQNNSEWCKAYFTALDDIWRYAEGWEVELKDGRLMPEPTAEPSYEKVFLVVVDRWAKGMQVFFGRRLPGGECANPDIEINAFVSVNEGPVEVVMSKNNEDCGIVIDEILVEGVAPSREK